MTNGRIFLVCPFLYKKQVPRSSNRAGHSLCFMLVSFGAVDEARTRDPQLGKLMLYQLSYYRSRFCKDSANLPINPHHSRYFFSQSLIFVSFCRIAPPPGRYESVSRQDFAQIIFNLLLCNIIDRRKSNHEYIRFRWRVSMDLR